MVELSMNIIVDTLYKIIKSDFAHFELVRQEKGLAILLIWSLL